MNIAEILNLKYPEQLKNGQIELKNEGKGIYISKWQMGSIPKPSEAEILTWEIDPIIIENKAIYNRINAADGYGSVSDQLDMIYKDLRDGTQLWQNHIGNVKDNLYPKTGIPTTPPDISPIITAKRNSPSASFKEIVIAKSSAIQAVAGTAKTNVALNVEVADPNNIFTNNTYTALTGGLYEITAFVQITNVAITSSVTNYSWNLYLSQTGSSAATNIIGNYTHGAPYPLTTSMQGTQMLFLKAGDKLNLQVDKTLNNSLNITFAYINIKKISEA